MNIEEEARRAFDSGYNCAESVLFVVSQHTELKKENIDFVIPKIATGFGGGIARNGDLCGAISGGVMAISLALGRNKPDENQKRCYDAVDRFYDDFVKTFGTCKCRELTGVNLKAPEVNEAHRNRIHRERCTPLVEWAARMSSKIIKDNQTK